MFRVLWWVMKGRAEAPISKGVRMGVSTSKKPFSSR